MWNSGLWGLVIVCMTVGWVVTTWIRAKHGYPLEDSLGGHVDRAGHPDVEKKLNDELAKRDATVAKLEERIRVLERIVTDRSAKLDDEFDRLRA